MRDNLIDFNWSGINRKGEHIQGICNAEDRKRAITKLQTQGILVKKIKRVSDGRFSLTLKRSIKSKKITSSDITVFTRQIGTMLEAGIPLLQIFDNIIQGQRSHQSKMKILLTDIKNDISAGKTLYGALERHPKHFNPLFCNLISAGEHSGTLGKMFDNLASYREKMEALKRKVKTALSYPLIILVMAVLVSSILLIFVIPEFQNLFDELGADLPAATKFVIKLSHFSKNNWGYLLISLMWLIYTIGINSNHAIFFKTPILGELLKKSSLAHFFQTLALTFAAGISLLDAIPIAGKTSMHPSYTDASLRIKAGITKGNALHQAMAETKAFPILAIQMIAIGESSGTLEKMLAKIAKIYEDEIDNTLESSSRLLEPILMTILGIIVGGLIISMYLPIFKLESII